YESLVAAGVVLTGGASRMEGALELAEEIFHKMVRIGMPQQVEGLGDVVTSPLHATGVGLLLHGARVGGAEFLNGGGGMVAGNNGHPVSRWCGMHRQGTPGIQPGARGRCQV